MKYLTATGDRVLRAYNKAVRTMERDLKMLATEHSAGFIIPDGQQKVPKMGFQVFVRVARYDESVLKSHPMTGGLLERYGAEVRHEA